MKRRQIISGSLGFFSALSVSQWKASTPLVGRSRTHIPIPLNLPDSLEFYPLDPPSDNERPTQLANQLDHRDHQTMSVSKHQSSATENKTRRLDKSVDFARDFDDDIFVATEDEQTHMSLSHRLQRLQKTVGFGNFNVLSFDEALIFAKRYSQIGEFTKEEISYTDKLFHTNAADYGFFGEKVSTQLTKVIDKRNTKKIPYTGHYVFQGKSLEHYEKLRQEVGDSIILTSGIRSNVKQLHLFIAKSVRVNNNLSRASRSLAPPGYSYHGVGDYDVGRIGWGAKNFTEAFAETSEFKKMQDLGYIAIRYDLGNNLGVRFEPWHIKVV